MVRKWGYRSRPLLSRRGKSMGRIRGSGRRFRGGIGREKKPRGIRGLPNDLPLNKHFLLDSGRVLGYISYTTRNGERGAREFGAPFDSGHTARPYERNPADLPPVETEDTIVHATAIVTDPVVTRSGPPAAPRCRARVRHFRTGIRRRKCRQAGRVGRDRHSRPASGGRECRVGGDLSTRCPVNRRKTLLRAERHRSPFMSQTPPVVRKRMESTSCTLSTNSGRTAMEQVRP